MKINLDKSKTIGVAVSGGIDSMVLLHMLISEGYKVAVINIEHGIRGEASKQDTKFVKTYCKENNIEFIGESVKSLSYAKQNKISVELAARELRYEVFDHLLLTGKVSVIALAHHLNDQAETILMRIFRGTGIRGLKGIVDREGYIHPLISTPKADIIKYAKKNNIPYVEDETNNEDDYARNYIRNKVMPVILKKYPDVLSSFERLSKNAEEMDDYLESKARKSTAIDDHKLYLPIKILVKHPALAKRSIVNALAELGVVRDIEKEHLANIIALNDSENNKSINLPFDVDVTKVYDKLVFTKREVIDKFSKKFSLDSTYAFGDKIYKFYKEEADVKDIIYLRSNLAQVKKTRNAFCLDDKCEMEVFARRDEDGDLRVLTNKFEKKEPLYFDADKLDATVVRTRENGDMFKPCNGYSQLLSDYLNKKKIPLAERERLLVAAKDNQIYMILGYEIANEIKLTVESKNVYKMYKITTSY